MKAAGWRPLQRLPGQPQLGPEAAPPMTHRRLALTLGLLYLLCCCGVGPALAEEALRNSLSLAAGIGHDHVSPGLGLPLVLRYERSLGRAALALLARGVVMLNADTPAGSAVKGSTYGLDVGVGWHTGPPGSLHLLLGGLVGGWGSTEPGVGGVARALVGLHIPVGAHLAVLLEASAWLGAGRVGDDPSRAGLLAGVDTLAGARVSF